MNYIRIYKRIIFLLLTLIFIVFYIYSRHLKSRLELESSLEIRDVQFNKLIDLVMFLHIPKTGGTNFENNLVTYLRKYNGISKKWERACFEKPKNVINETKAYAKYFCPRDDSNEFTWNKYYTLKSSWFFGRQTFAWGLHWKCNVHADFAKLRACSLYMKETNEFLGRIHFITIIRDPIQRYVSEWNHVSRQNELGYNVIFNTKNVCNKEVTMSGCLPEIKTNELINLEQFTYCENNVAENRQTRMLAYYNENQANCSLFNTENREDLLETAKTTLRHMSYFALTEYDDLSRKLFEKTFQNRIRFQKIADYSSKRKTLEYVKNMDKGLLEKIKNLNDLDLELYDYAKKLFFERLKFYGI
jgi:hypothetical protein